MNRITNWVLLTGCQVKTQSGWIPAENWRTID